MFFASALLVGAATAADFVNLLTFDGADGTSFSFKLVNDPVMGGRSYSNYTVNKGESMLSWQGSCEIVPSLKAPGFCNLETNNPYFSHFADATGMDAIEIKMRSRMDYTGFKFSFAGTTFNPQFKCYKSDFTVKSDGQWQTVQIPWNAFSNDWSPSTGEPNKRCENDANVCPKSADLKNMHQLGFWMEGVEGKFDVDIQYLRAVKTSGNSYKPPKAMPSSVEAEAPITDKLYNSTCSGPIQKNLRFNMGVLPPDVPAYYPLEKNETLGDAVCCDPRFSPFAEPQFTFMDPRIDLFSRLNSDGTTTFYDSACGVALFRAPIGRTFAEWKAETEEHGWPSFRPAEVLASGGVKIDPVTNFVTSKCGTHLGSNVPDGKGIRYCLDLVCISGNPTNKIATY